jgi:hypothetical protein
MEDIFGEELTSEGTVKASKSSRKRADVKDNCLPVEQDVMQISYIRCFRKQPNHKGSTKGVKRDPGFEPFLAAIRYRSGGIAFFKVSKTTGNRNSEIYIHWPNRCTTINSAVMNSSKILSAEDPSQLVHEFVRIVGDNRHDAEKRKQTSLKLKAQWADGHVSWISATSANTKMPETTYLYAVQSNLLDYSRWYMLRRHEFSVNNNPAIRISPTEADHFLDSNHKKRKRRRKQSTKSTSNTTKTRATNNETKNETTRKHIIMTMNNELAKRKKSHPDEFILNRKKVKFIL